VDPQTYQSLADECLQRAQRWAEGFDPDAMDCSTSDGVVTLEFPDGAKFVLNRQSAAQQMWFAAGARAWHYDWSPERRQWVDDRDGHSLRQRLAEVVASKLGRKVNPP